MDFFVDAMPEASQTPGPVLADHAGCHVRSGRLDHPAVLGIMSELPSPQEGRGSNSKISTFGVGDEVLMWQSNRVSPPVHQHNCLFSPLVYPSNLSISFLYSFSHYLLIYPNISIYFLQLHSQSA